MKRFLALAIITGFAALGAHPSLAAHPESSSDCAKCHSLGASSDAPKVVGEEPSFLGRLLQGKKAFKGHPSLSCAGAKGADGKITGCHAPEKGFPHLLITDTKGKPSDEFCGQCHAEHRKPGLHHPSYKKDKNGDGVVDTLIRPASKKPIFSTFSPAAKPEPLASFPDALLFTTTPEGAKKLQVALPLETVVEKEGDKLVTYKDVTGCSTCHNPHFGYLVEVGKEEDMKATLAARPKGDALLRMRDYDNALCVACH